MEAVGAGAAALNTAPPDGTRVPLASVNDASQPCMGAAPEESGNRGLTRPVQQFRRTGYYNTAQRLKVIGVMIRRAYLHTATARTALASIAGPCRLASDSWRTGVVALTESFNRLHRYCQFRSRFVQAYSLRGSRLHMSVPSGLPSWHRAPPLYTDLPTALERRTVEFPHSSPPTGCKETS